MRISLLIESLESRRLMSTTITASSLFSFTKGASWSEETLLNGSLLSTSTETVGGSTTYNGNKCTLEKSTTTGTLGTSNADSYSAFDKAGDLISYATVTNSTTGG